MVNLDPIKKPDSQEPHYDRPEWIVVYVVMSLVMTIVCFGITALAWR